MVSLKMDKVDDCTFENKSRFINVFISFFLFLNRFVCLCTFLRPRDFSLPNENLDLYKIKQKIIEHTSQIKSKHKIHTAREFLYAVSSVVYQNKPMKNMPICAHSYFTCFFFIIALLPRMFKFPFGNYIKLSISCFLVVHLLIFFLRLPP